MLIQAYDGIDGRIVCGVVESRLPARLRVADRLLERP
jgi:uncharacterized protein with HEPN domain